MNLALVWFIMVLIALVTVPSLLRSRQWGDLMGFATLWLVAGIYASIILGIEGNRLRIPNHTELVRLMMLSIYGWLGLDVVL